MTKSDTLKRFFDMQKTICLHYNKKSFKIMMAKHDMLEQTKDNMNCQSKLLRYLRYTLSYNFDISNYFINF